MTSPIDIPSGPVRKAVIPAAGLGTRFLPFSKAVPKEMLPIVDRPVIQHVVEEAVDAGIDDILIITSRHKRSIEDHFDRMPDLERHLKARGRHGEAAEMGRLAELARLHFVRQGTTLGLGHAVGMARDHVGDDPFVVLLGDSIMDRRVGAVRAMIDAHHEHRCSVVALTEVDRTRISAYGCASVETVSDRLCRVTGLVEKPAPDQAPSNLAVMGRYLFTPEIFDAIEHTDPGVGGEIQLTDAVQSLAARGAVMGVILPDGRFDTGDKVDYLRAVVEFALDRDDVGPGLRAVLAEIVGREDITASGPTGDSR